MKVSLESEEILGKRELIFFLRWGCSVQDTNAPMNCYFYCPTS